MVFEFSFGIRLTHFFQFSLLVRSGVEILGAHPKLFWTDHCTPEREWIRFTRKRMRPNSLWTAEDEIQPFSSWMALPGHNNLGLGRQWHFWSVTGWILCGAAYMVALFATPEWSRIIPTSWQIIPNAWQALRTYADFSIPAGQPLHERFACRVHVDTLDEKWERTGHGDYYEVIDFETAVKPQVILAYEMNGAPLSVEHGAPIRLRVEHQLGYKMAKWVSRIELVEDFRGIAGGQGGWRDDVLHYYPSDAGI
jgi:hypothetical protein